MTKISSANLVRYLSGGAGNADPAASLGGARSTATQAPETLNGLFDLVHGDEAAAGRIEYRCIYFRNEDANADGLMDPVKLWISEQTTSDDTSLDIGLDPAGKNGTATTIALDTSAPAGVTFTAPSSKSGGLSLPGVPYAQNDYVAIWVRRTVDTGAASTALDESALRVEGDTL